ncbi:hypothetical protein DTO207G8_318 [Paecilomyces variotii]|nr:hypothetical protein DTO207G8_318 [Paecilomyces variotii]
MLPIVVGATPSSVAMASAFVAAAGAYLNAKLGISTDLTNLYHDRDFGKRLAQCVNDLGESQTVYGLLERGVEFHGKGASEALWFEGKTWTYAQLKDLVDKFAEVLHARGIRPGDFVAVFTTNSPEMVICIQALSKLGAVAAMINTNLRDETFLHCLNVSNAKMIIASPDLAQFVIGDQPRISLNIGSFDGIIPETAELISLQDLQTQPSTGLKAAKRSIVDLAVLIYTSGTTGMPKACAVPNMVMLVTANPLTRDLSNPSKYYPMRIYSPLPLFHGTAMFAGMCYSLGNLGTFCLRRKFSSSQFWKDVHDSRATRIMYIGELCRYLLATPPSPYDRNHSCRVAAGNGLRGEIWERFKERFGVPEIREFYRSTEGVAKYDNMGEGAWGVGKIGFSGPIRRLMEDDVIIVKYDPETEMPYRDPKTGFCVKAKLNEEGEAIGRVKNRALLTEYLGNKEATEKKLIRNVFRKGDLFQRSGDLLVHESSGWIRFQDRVGDTFRWKGENVSAGEVRDHICRLPGVHDAVVYGVRLQSYDGQAGAAAITLEKWTPESEREFISTLYKALRAKGVPTYAIPRFVRFIEKVSTGVTFKQAKGDLAKKGWDPRKDAGGDSLYWLNGSQYQPLDESSWTGIEAGAAKL